VLATILIPAAGPISKNVKGKTDQSQRRKVTGPRNPPRHSRSATRDPGSPGCHQPIEAESLRNGGIIMFTQIKRIVVAFSTIFFLIGAMPTATAQSVFDIEADRESESVDNSKALGRFQKTRSETELELFISLVPGAEENEVIWKRSVTQENSDGSGNAATCSFKGESTSISGPYSSPYGFQYWGIFLIGEATMTVSVPWYPDVITYTYDALHANLTVYDYFDNTWNADSVVYHDPTFLVPYCLGQADALLNIQY
jgi:hypothetical protein